MKATVSSLDSGTGEYESLQLDVESFTAVALARAVDKYIADCAGSMSPEYGSHKVESWIPVKGRPGEAAFILSAYDPYFGPIVIAGIVFALEE